MSEALFGQAEIAKLTAKEEGLHYTKVLDPWFEGLATVLYPLILKPLSSEPTTFQNAVGAWLWAFEVRVPGVNAILAHLTVRLFINPMDVPGVDIQYSIHHAEVGPPQYTATKMWQKVMDYADDTLDEPGTFSSFSGRRVYLTGGGPIG